MKYCIFLLFFFGLSFTYFAQPNVAPTKVVDGKTFYVHKVEKGQTLYGISKLYSVSIADITNNNLGAEGGIAVGQELLIPSATATTTTPVKPVESIQGEPTTTTSTPANPSDSVIIHTVAAGETMYSISKKYSVDFNELVAANPDKTKGIQIGDKVKVPTKNANKTNEVVPLVKNPVNPTVGPKDSVILHKVEAGQTLFSLAKQYEVTEQSIKDANNGLAEGLKKGNQIRIIVPKKVTTNSTTTVVNTTNQTTQPTEYKEVYNVAVMLPFNTAENRALRAKCPPIGDCPYYSYTVMSFGFRNGIMMAIDSLKKAGMNVNVSFYDSRNDSASVAQLLTKPEMKTMDIIFGPLFPAQIKQVSLFARQQQIQNVIPVPVSNKALFNNPYVTKATASVHTQITYLAQYVAKNYHQENVILVKNKNSSRENDNFSAFVKAYNADIKKYAGRTHDSIRSTSMGSGSSLTGVESLMSATKVNVIVVPSEDLGHVSSFVTKLNSTGNKNPYTKYQIKVFGLEEWLSFETIDEKFKNRYNFHLCTSTFIDYTQPEINRFIRNYRSQFGTDPDNYSFNMFDAAFVNLKGLFLYGKGYAGNYQYLEEKGLSFNSSYRKADANSGYENGAVRIIQYDNYRVKVVN
jgi:LysM repeat protein